MTEPYWRALAPLRETDSVMALAARGGLALAGTAAGLYRRDAGGAWRRLELAATEIQAIAFGDSASFVAAGAGSAVDVSEDGGAAWQRGELGTTARVTALGVGGASILAGTDTGGAFLSLNGGTTWSACGLEGQMVLAALGDKLAGTDQGLWRRESAATWRKLRLEAVVTALARVEGALLAGTEDQGLFRSSDEGASWHKCASIDEGINALGASGKRAIAGTSVGRLYESRDGGASWNELPSLPTAVMSVAVDGELVLAGAYRAGLFELAGGKWQPANNGLESTNALDMLWTPDGLLVVAMDGLRRLADGEWQALPSPGPGDIRAAAVCQGDLVVATTEGIFGPQGKLAPLAEVTLLRAAPNGDLAALSETALHLRLGGSWQDVPRSERERTIDVLFSPAYPEDEGLLLVTLRQGTRTSVVRYRPSSREVERIFDRDQGSRWLSVALPEDYRADARRPAGFFAGSGGSLFRPAWPGDTWQRDILHDPNAVVLSIALSPNFKDDKTVAAGTTTGAVITRNGGLLWLTLDAGLEDRRCLKVVYSSKGRLYCLTPTRVYELVDG
jgi:hypothetical protein